MKTRGTVRPIVYRASLSEMVVPYGDSAPTHWNKNVFDMGEVGMGLMANPLELGCDCLGHIHYFDGIVNSSSGAAVVIPNAVCMHEEDVGISWKHTDFRTGAVEVRRSRRLVISTIATVGNYEYGFFWYLYTDGTIEYDVKLSGVLTTGAIAAGEQPRYGQLVAPGLYGPNHQHFFSVRLDMSVDGPLNSVYEVDSVPEENPGTQSRTTTPGSCGRHWSGRSPTVARNVDYSTARFWRIVNVGKEERAWQPRRVQAHAHLTRAADDGEEVLHLRPRTVRPARRVGHRLRPGREVRRRRTTRTSHPTSRDCRILWPATSRWRTATSCCG